MATHSIYDILQESFSRADEETQAQLRLHCSNLSSRYQAHLAAVTSDDYNPHLADGLIAVGTTLCTRLVAIAPEHEPTIRHASIADLVEGYRRFVENGWRRA